eukprot:SAG31_NODE_882_length_11260_cov_3.357104_9_plen_260_part_00
MWCCSVLGGMVGDILNAELERAGVELSNHMCEHFSYSRAELCTIIKVKELRTWDAVLANCGNGGGGCEICKPAVASIFASLYPDKPVHLPETRTMQDTNDRNLANIQRGGSYSVVPRIPGGEITPTKLKRMCEVAEKYGLYMKVRPNSACAELLQSIGSRLMRTCPTQITGAQRVDMFGAPVQTLPDIWEELVDAGFESGHAYAKALRAVKSCVGSTWCRYGMQDSVGFAIKVEERYRGIRFPHKVCTHPSLHLTAVLK